MQRVRDQPGKAFDVELQWHDLEEPPTIIGSSEIVAEARASTPLQ
jgi:hypothetical protein